MVRGDGFDGRNKGPDRAAVTRKAGAGRLHQGEAGGAVLLSPRFIANVEFGDSTFSLDSLMTVCRVLSCSSDYLLFGASVDTDNAAWEEPVSRLRQLDVKYQEPVNKIFQGVIEAIVRAEQ